MKRIKKILKVIGMNVYVVIKQIMLLIPGMMAKLYQM